MESHYECYYEAEGLETWRRLGGYDKARNIRRLWGDRVAPTVIEVGCGDGAVAEHLAATTFFTDYVGVDISGSGIRKARAKRIDRAKFALFDGRRIPVRNQRFDLAVLSHVLEHVEEPRSLLRECARVARYVFVEVPLELNIRSPRDFTWDSVGHINLFNPLLLRHIVQSSDLAIVDQRTTAPGYASVAFRKGRLLGCLVWSVKTSLLRMSPRIATTLLTYHGCVLARSHEDPNGEPSRA